jgi:anti-sigma factor RsiW
MNPISHLQARAWLDSAVDLALSPEQRAALEGHLAGCDECRRYEAELANLEGALRQSLQAHLPSSHAPLSLEEVLQRVRASQPTTAFANRWVAAPVLLVVLLTIIFTLGSPRGIGGGTHPTQALTATALLAPTPSAPITSTLLSLPECKSIRYQVQAGDTLDAIARQFSVSKDVLMTYNHLTAESLPAELSIPMCSVTPLVGSQTPSSTVTMTPQAEYTMSTP